MIVDLVANHTSSEHPWFAAALAAGPGSPERERYFFRDGRAGGERAAERLDQRLRWPGLDPRPGGRRPAGAVVPAPVRPRAARPGLEPARRCARTSTPSCGSGWTGAWTGCGSTWRRPWPRCPGCPTPGTSRGHGSSRARGSATRTGTSTASTTSSGGGGAIGDSYDGDRLFVTEAVVRDPERLSRYVRPDEMHTSFNFDYLTAPWEPRRLRQVIDESIAALDRVGAPPTWVLSQPRRDPARDPVRPRRERGRDDGLRHRAPAHRPGPGPAPGPRGRAAHPGAARLAPTSTRARSSGCRRSRTCRRRRSRTRPGNGRATRPGAGTAAACRCRGTGERAAVRVHRRAASRRGCPSPSAGGR